MWLLVSAGVLFAGAWAAQLTTNAVKFEGAPSWLTARQIEKTTDRVERKLAWNVRQVRAQYIASPAEFMKAHGLPTDAAIAVTFAKRGEILVGPAVNAQNFDEVFAHELVHVTIYQKLKGAIPAWLEEGLANWVAGRRKVDYAYIRSQGIASVAELVHPFGANLLQAKQYTGRYHYEASTALMAMLSRKCDMDDLIQLSVGRKLETYLRTACGIENIDREFKKWVESQR